VRRGLLFSFALTFEVVRRVTHVIKVGRARKRTRELLLPVSAWLRRPVPRAAHAASHTGKPTASSRRAQSSRDDKRLQSRQRVGCSAHEERRRVAMLLCNTANFVSRIEAISRCTISFTSLARQAGRQTERAFTARKPATAFSSGLLTHRLLEMSPNLLIAPSQKGRGPVITQPHAYASRRRIRRHHPM
jgi:hypothetical protein